MTNPNKNKGDRHWPLSPTLRDRLMARLAVRPNGCWEWTGYIRPHGYGQIGNGTRRVIDTHRASWMVHNGRIPDQLWVLHKCDNRICCNPDHLYLGTVQDNVNDMHDRGRARKAMGIKSSNGRLTDAQVADIRRRWRPGRAAGHGVRTGNTAELALEFGVSKQYIGQLCRGLWRQEGA